jgi:SagB-type dehydrogenase family enzyme
VSGNVKYRRSPHLVCYWKNGAFVFQNYAEGTLTRASPIGCEVLEFFSDWKPAEALYKAQPAVDRGTLRRVLAMMVKARLLQRSDARPSPAERAMTSMDRWNPEAGFFHTATRNVRFTPRAVAERLLEHQAGLWPMPPPVKRYRGARTVKLPAPSSNGPLTESVLSRRTWRRFGKGTIPLRAFGELLGLTAGVQHWVSIPPHGKVALKTAPSGGARHPVELYVLAWGIRGLAKGLYHYAPDVHRLELIRPGLDARRVPEYLPHGDYWSNACALVIFSAVYERNLWRYQYSRAYRAPLIEAGHLCQTFLLLATSMGLAPFSAMGLSDDAIERDLGLDGITESVLYVAGVGVRPAATDWAPAPAGMKAPRIERNPHIHPRRSD